MKKIVYATKNPAKVAYMKKVLQPLKLEIQGLDTLETPNIEENGINPLENARYKAMQYYKILKKPLFSCDSGLYIQNLPDKLQPGLHVRRPYGKYLNDEEMIQWYSRLARQYGNLKAFYINAICYIEDLQHIYESDDISLWSLPFLIVDTPHHKIDPGFPLDRLTKNIETNTYIYDQEASANINEYVGFCDFFKQCLFKNM